MVFFLMAQAPPPNDAAIPPDDVEGTRPPPHTPWRGWTPLATAGGAAVGGGVGCLAGGLLPVPFSCLAAPGFATIGAATGALLGAAAVPGSHVDLLTAAFAGVGALAGAASGAGGGIVLTGANPLGDPAGAISAAIVGGIIGAAIGGAALGGGTALVLSSEEP